MNNEVDHHLMEVGYVNTEGDALARADAEIACADYRDFLDDLETGSIDLVLTDPPYGISRETGFANVKNGLKRFAVSMDFAAWDHETIDLEDLSARLFRVLRQGGTAIVWYDLWKLSALKSALEIAGFTMFRQLMWQKTNPVPLNSQTTYLSNSREMAIACVKGGKPTFHSSYDNGVYSGPIPRFNGTRIHPTQKPVDLFADLVTKHSNRGDLVCDPFIGSGTTAFAANREGRRFVGCDIDAHYVASALDRLHQRHL